jgi:hypothetical protein
MRRIAPLITRMSDAPRLVRRGRIRPTQDALRPKSRAFVAWAGAENEIAERLRGEVHGDQT